MVSNWVILPVSSLSSSLCPCVSLVFVLLFFFSSLSDPGQFEVGRIDSEKTKRTQEESKKEKGNDVGGLVFR